MKKNSTALFWAIEINLVCWLGIFGFIMHGDFSKADITTLKYFSITGGIIAAILQHWAYYKIYKPAKQRKKEEKQNRVIEKNM